MIDTQVAPDHVVARRLLRTLPLDEARYPTVQPIIGRQERGNVRERRQEGRGVLALAIPLHEPWPHVVGDVAQRRRLPARRRGEVGCERPERGRDLGDLGQAGRQLALCVELGLGPEARFGRSVCPPLA